MTQKLTRITLLIFLDAIAINLSYLLVLYLRFEMDIQNELFRNYVKIYLGCFIVVTLLKIVVFYLFDLYNSLWKYASTTELVKIILAVIFAAAAATTYLAMSHNMLPRSVIVIAVVFDILFIGGSRFSYRAIRGIYYGSITLNAIRGIMNSRKPDIEKLRLGKKIMVVGAGDAGSAIIKELQGEERHKQSVVTVVDDDLQKIGKKIHGVKIDGVIHDIPIIAEQQGIDEIIIAIPSADKVHINRIVNECNKTKCKVKILPGLADLINEKVSVTKLRNVDILDLLGREEITLDIAGVSKLLKNKVVLVTGGAGSIGSELCRQIAKFGPSKIISVDVNENSLYYQNNEMNLLYPGVDFEAIVASVRNPASIRNVFSVFKPQIVFHAAAHKHVPLMEKTPKEAILNNIIGTKNVADIAADFGIERFILISTDKAVNPTNVMGATKRAAEFIIQDKAVNNNNKDTIFSAVRFGNVLDSNGSVIPTFKKQIEMGGPVTVTHEEITRYFMTIPEAAQLVIQAGALAKGGEIFILDMGQPVKILDLARNMIELSGYKPYEDIEIKITGLRPGEKLYEELLMAEEGLQTTASSKIFIGNPTPPNPAMIGLLVQLLPESTTSGLENLRHNLKTMTDEEVKAWLAEIIPTYKRG